MSGTDDPSNIVSLTPEEHYTAHLLLVKIYPANSSLIYAANMMCVPIGDNLYRSKNKRYGWLKRRLSEQISKRQTGTANSQYGSIWIYHIDMNLSKKIQRPHLDEYLSNGWATGRICNFVDAFRTCPICGNTYRVYNNKKTCGIKCSNINETFKRFVGQEEEFKKHYLETGSMNKSLKLMGYPGAMANYYRWAKSVLDNIK